MYEKQVAAGMEWLDEHFPGWRGRVNAEVLRQGSADRCVLAQAAVVEYWAATEALGLKWDGDETLRLGFRVSALLPLWDTAEEWDMLTEEWKAAIRERGIDNEDVLAFGQLLRHRMALAPPIRWSGGPCWTWLHSWRRG